MSKSFLILLLFFIHITSFFGQNPLKNEYLEGIPYIFNYNSGEYYADQQNWAVIEDHKGVVYFANGSGVLEFDGSGWRLIRLPNRAGAYSLALNVEGKIFVGGNNELGFLEADNLGNLQYKSLLSKIPTEYRNFEEVKHTFSLNTKIVFITRFYIYLFDNEKFTVIKPKNEFVNSFKVQDKIYVQEKDGLLKILNNTELQEISNQKILDNEEINAILPFKEDEILLITKGNKCFSFNGKSFKNSLFLSQASIFSGHITSAMMLPNGFYALGTLKKGLFILNTKGRVIYHLDKSTGLENDFVTHIHADTHSNLWLTLGNGLSYIELSAPFAKINEVDGLFGITQTACIHNDLLYVGTTQGIFYKKWIPYREDSYQIESFHLVENADVRAWHIEKIDNQLFCLHQNGILMIEGTKAKSLFEGESVWSIMPLNHFQDKIIAGTSDGLILLSKESNKWKFSNRIGGFSEKVAFLQQDKLGRIWISHEAKGLYRITLSNNLDLIKEMSRYGTSHGLPSFYQNRIFKIHGNLAVGTENGIYVYSENENRFYSYQTLNQYIDKGTSIKWLVEEPWGDIWFQAGDAGKNSNKPLSDIGVFKKLSDKSFKAQRLPFYKLRGLGVEDITPIDSSHILFETTDGIIQYSKLVNKNYYKTFNALIRSLEILGKEEKSFFTGVVSGTEQFDLVSKNPSAKPVLNYENNSIKFTVGATFYESPEATQYQYFLEGFDENWSDWTTTTHKEYTNLGDGNYVFRVRAKNIYEVESNETVYAFSVTPPFYLNAFSLLGFGVLALLIVWGVVQLNTYYLNAKNLRLEKIIKDRTKEIQEQNKLLITRNREINDSKFKLRQAHEELKNINENLEQIVNERTAKLQKANEELDLFVYRASHDLKGPLMRLLGLSQLALMETKEASSLEYLKWIEKNIQEMDSTLDKLLMVNVINHSTDKKEKLDFIEIKEYLLKYVYQHFPQAKNVDIRFQIEEGLLFLSDDDLVKIVIENLLENSILYSNKHINNAFSEVTIKLIDNKLYVKVHDNGIGIQAEHLPKIYDMFFRGTDESKGNGLGLYVVKKALEKLHGEIECKSQSGKYTTFEVWISA
jgi:signal transduction histidine kinase